MIIALFDREMVHRFAREDRALERARFDATLALVQTLATKPRD